jgi:predicted NBD/HSP70 family sugar kinase
MTAPFDLKDKSVVVIVGTGAGGGVLANEKPGRIRAGIERLADLIRRKDN